MRRASGRMKKKFTNVTVVGGMSWEIVIVVVGRDGSRIRIFPDSRILYSNGDRSFFHTCHTAICSAHVEVLCETTGVTGSWSNDISRYLE